MANVSDHDVQLWLRWLDNQWEEPNRSDHYLMQLSADIHNLFSPTFVSTESRKLKWVPKKPVDAKAAAEIEQQKALAFEQAMLARLGV